MWSLNRRALVAWHTKLSPRSVPLWVHFIATKLVFVALFVSALAVIRPSLVFAADLPPELSPLLLAWAARNALVSAVLLLAVLASSPTAVGLALVPRVLLELYDLQSLVSADFRGQVDLLAATSDPRAATAVLLIPASTFAIWRVRASAVEERSHTGVSSIPSWALIGAALYALLSLVTGYLAITDPAWPYFGIVADKVQAGQLFPQPVAALSSSWAVRNIALGIGTALACVARSYTSLFVFLLARLASELFESAIRLVSYTSTGTMVQSINVAILLHWIPLLGLLRVILKGAKEERRRNKITDPSLTI